MARAQPEAPADKLALYDALLATNPAVERKGARGAYTSLNGHMFSFLGKDGAMALRLGKDDRETFLAEFDTQLSVQYGTVMKEYVVVPDALLENTEELKRYFDLSYAYVGSLKPKPTTRTKKATAKK